MIKIFQIILMMSVGFNVYASSFSVELQDLDNNVQKVKVEDTSTLIELINNAEANQLLIKSIKPQGEVIDSVRRGGGEGGEDG